MRKNFTFTRICEGNMLGETEIMMNIDKRKYSFMTKKGAELLTLSKKEFIKLVWVDYREIGKQVMIQAAEKMKMLKSEYRKGLNHIKKNKDKMALLMEDENDNEKRKSVKFKKKI